MFFYLILRYLRILKRVTKDIQESLTFLIGDQSVKLIRNKNLRNWMLWTTVRVLVELDNFWHNL